MNYSFDDARAADTHTTQYFEMFVNRGIYHNGWTAVTRHSIPWVFAEMPAFDDDVWELYGPDDWTQAHDLSAENPEMLAHLQRLFIIEAGKYNVLPLDDRRFGAVQRGPRRPAPTDQGQHPDPVRRDGTTHRELGGGDEEQVVRHHVRGRGPRRAEPVAPSFPRAGPSAGCRSMRHEGKPAFCYNFFGLQQFKVYGTDRSRRVTSGPRRVRLRRWRTGQGRQCHALRRRDTVGEGRVDATVPMLFSADETTDVGTDTATPVTDDLSPKDVHFTREGEVGSDRPGRGRRGRRPSDLPGGALPDRHGPAVARVRPSSRTLIASKIGSPQEVDVPREFQGKIELTTQDSTPDLGAFLADRAPEGSPNVLVVLYDDTGLAAWSPFGGRIEMPTLQKLADNGSHLQPVAHHRPVLADPIHLPHRSQPPPERVRPDRRRGTGIPRLQLAHPAGERDDRPRAA